MDGSRWERYAAIGGVIFVVLNVVGALIGGSPPAPSDSAAKIAKYYADKDTALETAMWLGGIGTMGLAWWFGSLWRRMARAEGGAARLGLVSLIGLTLAGSGFLASTAVNTAAALRAGDIGDSAPYYYTLGVVLLGAAGFGIAVHLFATNVLAVRTRILPIWVAGLGVLAGLGFVVSGIVASADDSKAGMVIGLLSFLAWCVWILVVSFVIWRGDDTTPLHA
jgi:hypothetical protein